MNLEYNKIKTTLYGGYAIVYSRVVGPAEHNPHIGGKDPVVWGLTAVI